MKTFQKTLDVDGKFQLDATLTYNETTWEVTYFFAPTKQDVVVGGSITDGTLTIDHDNCGYCAPMLPVFQSMYEDALLV